MGFCSIPGLDGVAEKHLLCGRLARETASDSAGPALKAPLKGLADISKRGRGGYLVDGAMDIISSLAEER